MPRVRALIDALSDPIRELLDAPPIRNTAAKTRKPGAVCTKKAGRKRRN